MEKEVPILYANCIPVKGATKSIICDLQRHNYIYIPNDLYTILSEHPDKSIDEIKTFYENKYNDIIDNYFEILLKHDFIFLTNTPELFPKLKLDWYEPFEITNAIVDIDAKSAYNLEQVLKQLSAINCKFVQLRFYKQVYKQEIDDIFKFLNSIESNSIGIEILVPFHNDLTEEDCQAFFNQYKRLNSFTVYASPEEKYIQAMGHSRYFIKTGFNITSEKHCGFISKSMFSINTKTFTESKSYNSCLNGKISIDKHGAIKNCPSMTKSFGNIENSTLEEALLDKQFKTYWTLSKDNIDTCKDCEFRYICTDCRAYIEDPNNPNSKPLKCGYDPYKGTWENWSESDLKKDSITHYDF